MGVMETTARITLTFITLYIMCRLLGKKLIAQMTFFDYVAGITIGSLGASFVFSNPIPIRSGLWGVILFGIFALLTDILSIKMYEARKILNGEPLLVIKNGKILEDGILKGRLTMDDLLFLLRKKSIFYLDEVEYAFFETDGSISVQKIVANQSPKNQDLNISPVSRGIPQTFIIEGKIMLESLEATGRDSNWVNTFLQSKGINDLSKVAIAQIDEQGTVYLDTRVDR